MDRTQWLKLVRWYNKLHVVQQWLVKIGIVLFLLAYVMIVTHEPSERPRHTKIILDCYEGCGVDPERSIGYNEYIDRKKQEQRTWFRQENQRIQQEIWDDRGRQRWCKQHPNDKNCKDKK
jgi:hypothetical protein